MGRTTRAFTLIELMIAIVIIAIIAAIAIPNIVSARKNANESAAIGHLKTIANTQNMFRESDKELDGEYDFGTLLELSDTTLIDGTLGSGSRTGYHYATGAGSVNRGFLWFATANPALPTKSGDRYFCTNQRGQIFYTTSFLIPLNTTDCEMPPGLLLVR